jgi:predicted nucleotidyltransferase
MTSGPTVHAADVDVALQEFFATTAPEIVAAYLFGSHARGTARADSDVDVAILYDPAPPVSLEDFPFDIETALERRLGRPVQAIVLNRAPVDLVHRVLRDGRLLLDRDRGKRIRFEVRARAEFLDLKPVLDRYRAARPVAPVTDPDLVTKKLAPSCRTSGWASLARRASCSNGTAG